VGDASYVVFDKKIKVFLDAFMAVSKPQKTSLIRKHSASETKSVSILRRREEDAYSVGSLRKN
jgi:hypothetical protein